MRDGGEYLQIPVEVARRGVDDRSYAPPAIHLVPGGAALSLCALLFAATLNPAFSADLGAPQTGASDSPPAAATSSLGSGWVATLKANAGILPDWEGAKSYSFLAYPSVSLVRADALEWSSPDDGLDFSVYDAHGFSIGPVAAYELGRYRQ